MQSAAPRLAHGLVAAVAAVALLIQLGMVISGASVVATDPKPALGVRLVRLVSYFTIQSNVLVLVTSVVLCRNGHRDGPVWRVVRLNAMAGIVVTAVVHWFFLRPLVDLDGWGYAVDKLLHVAVPVLALTTWVLFGPRARVSWQVIGASLIWPVAWLVYVLILGAGTGWYPYPFLDVGVRGAGQVAVAAALIAAFLLTVCTLLLALDRSLPAGKLDRTTSTADLS